MNNTFEIKRFGNYLLYDLRNAYNNYIISLLIIGLLPVTCLLFYELFFLVTTGHPADNYFDGLEKGALFIATAIIILTFPVKAYGSLTDKRMGSNWIMIPASVFEKWLSMLVITCILLPLAFCLLFFGSDWLLSVIFPSFYGNPLIYEASVLGQELSEETNGLLNINIPAVSCLNWCENILIFTLGAMVFRTSKPSKTILALIVFGMAFSFICMLVLGSAHIGIEDIALLDSGSAEEFARKLHIFIAVGYTLIFTFLLGATFYRMKTIKH